ncbi:hypothetical protein AJ87_02725 [Rhizobium yanglingense]|nr:hypothetical protein AJ87_02725 [Rhizobium yanglingense]
MIDKWRCPAAVSSAWLASSIASAIWKALFFGKFGFVLRDAFPLPLIQCRGQLGFFNLEPEVLQLVAAAIREVRP